MTRSLLAQSTSPPAAENDLLGSVFWTSWGDVGRIVITVVVGYLALVALIRLFGKRTTSRMNNFDWVVAVATGAIFGTTIVSESVPLSNGLVALTSLLGLQFVVTAATSRFGWARSLFLAPARLLYSDGEVDEAAMLRERVSRKELESAVREAGLGSLDEVAAVVLESSAKIAVIPKGHDAGLDALDEVRGR